MGDPNADDTRAMTAALGRTFTPGLTTLLKPIDDEAAAARLAELAPFTAGMTAIDGAATAYICKGHQCDAPTTDPEEMAAKL